MKTSNETDKIDAALAKAQAEMTNPAFDSTNPHFKSKYASLAAVRNGIIPILAKHGIACVQELLHDEGKVGCATRLSCAGQWIEFAPFYLPPSKGDAQGYGSASTYARRYSLQAVAGVAGDEDDDGNAVAQPAKRKATANPVTPTAGVDERVSEKRKEILSGYVDAFNDAYERQDGMSAVELKQELTDADEQTYVWSFLDSKTRSFIKAAIAAANQPQQEAA
jgi:hypothetical protein